MKIDHVLIDHISKKIAILRKSRGWSQAHVARCCNITSAAICQLEKGATMPSLTVIIKLADLFNISVSEFIGETFCLEKNELDVFFEQFGHIKKLTHADQALILSFIFRLRKDYVE